MITHYLQRSQQEENVMRLLEAFIHRENLILFKKQLADPRLDDTKRQQLQGLFADERAKDLFYEKRSPVASHCR